MTRESSHEVKPEWSLKRRLGVVAAVAVPLVTAATIVISIAADSMKSPTSIDTLEHNASDSLSETAETELASASLAASFESPYYRNYFVPLSAPFDTISLDEAPEGALCSDAQLAWLEKYEVEPSGFGINADKFPLAVDFRNVATDGGSLSMKNLHAVADSSIPEVTTLRMTCGPPQGGFEWPQSVEIDFATGEPAAWGDPEDMDADPELVGTVFSINLSPGESTQVLLAPQWPAHQFSGRLVADVTAAGQTVEITLFDGIVRPYATEYPSFFLAGSSVYCFTDEAMPDCSPAEMMSLASK